MTQEQQHLLMSVHTKLVRLTEIGQVTENYHIRDLAHDAIDDLIKLRDLLTSEKGEYYLSEKEDVNAETALDKLRSEYGSTANEQTDDLGFKEFQNQKQ